MQLHPHHPALTLLIPLLPMIDIRRGSGHPLAWRGGDYRGELRATWQADRGRFQLPADTLVLGCGETLPVFAAVFRALGWATDYEQQQDIKEQ